MPCTCRSPPCGRSACGTNREHVAHRVSSHKERCPAPVGAHPVGDKQCHTGGSKRPTIAVCCQCRFTEKSAPVRQPHYAPEFGSGFGSASDPSSGRGVERNG